MNFRRITSFILLGIGLSCGHKPQSGKINIQIPWPEGSSYKLQFVPVGLTDLRNLSGPDVMFFDRPYITGDRESKELKGTGPVGKFSAVSEGNYVPATYESLLLATVYAHMERLNAQLKDLGYGSLMTLPRKVGINPRIRLAPGESLNNNAVYHEILDGIFVFPYEIPGLPLAFNGGVLAHEYFHSIFHHLFKKNLPTKRSAQRFEDHFNISTNINQPYICRLPPITGESCGRDEELSEREVNSFILSAMNEGLADTWAWIYTGDTDFIMKSFGERTSNRKMNGEFCSLPTHQSVRDLWVKVMRYRDIKCSTENAERTMAAYYYSYGTNLSRFLISFAQSGKMSRQELATAILETLKKMDKAVNAKPEINFDLFVNLFLDTAKELKKEISIEQCTIYGKVVSASGAKACAK